MQSSIYSSCADFDFSFYSNEIMLSIYETGKNTSYESTPCRNDQVFVFLISLDEKRKINLRSITMWCAMHLMRHNRSKKTAHEWETSKRKIWLISQNQIYQSSLHDSNFNFFSLSNYILSKWHSQTSSLTSAINFSFINSRQTLSEKTYKQSINLEIIKSWQYNACNLFYSNFNVVINNFLFKKKIMKYVVYRIG